MRPYKVMLLGWACSVGAATAIGVACNACKPPPASTPVDIGKLVACVEGEFERGDSDPFTIVEACPGATLAVISDVLQTLDKRAKYARAACTGSTK